MGTFVLTHFPSCGEKAGWFLSLQTSWLILVCISAFLQKGVLKVQKDSLKVVQIASDHKQNFPFNLSQSVSPALASLIFFTKSNLLSLRLSFLFCFISFYILPLIFLIFPILFSVHFSSTSCQEIGKEMGQGLGERGKEKKEKEKQWGEINYYNKLFRENG